MSSCNFSVHDVRFRRCGEDECTIVVYGQTVGTVTRRTDCTTPNGARFYVVHLYDDGRGPRQVDDRHQVRTVAAAMIAERDLVPWTPPPVHPDFRERQHPNLRRRYKLRRCDLVTWH